MSRCSLVVAVLVGMVAPLVAADVPKLSAKSEKTEWPTDIPATITAELDPNAVVILDEQKEVVLTLWFRATIPAKATADQVKNGLTYRELADGTLLGVVKFAKPFVDFRKQDVPAGVYALRFAVQPDTGDHMGTAPHPEFALLTPIAKETSPDGIEGKKLVERSATITDGDHPAVMLLFPNFEKGNGPTIATKDGNIVIAQVRRAVEAAEMKTTLGFALVVFGHSAKR